jgi:hypothetical protein
MRDQLMPTALALAADIVGNDEVAAVPQAEGLVLEATREREWALTHDGGRGVSTRRESIMARGRQQNA